MNNTTTEWTTRIAAAASASLEELIQELPQGSELAREARSLVAKLDKEFELASVSAPVVE